MTDLGSALDLLHRIYPNAYVTSGYRSPDSRLGRANPRSYHNIGRAFDIRPMKGVSFNDYVARLKAAGLPIVEALDEAARPLPHTTGPNWHIAFGPASGAPKKMPSPLARTLGLDTINITPQNLPVGPVVPAPQTQMPDLPMSFAKVLEAKPEKKGPLGLSKTQWGYMLAALADMFNARAGHSTNMLGSLLQMQQQAEENAQTQAYRDQMVELARERLTKPPQPTQTDRYIAQIMDPNTSPQLKAILRQVVMRPLVVPMYGADGSQMTSYYYPDQMGVGDDSDQWEYSN